MAELVKQPTALPTRKLTLGAVAGVVTAALQQWALTASEAIPAFAFLGQPVVEQAIPLLAMAIVGYVVKERAA